MKHLSIIFLFLGIVAQAKQPGFTVHEWGTFTSMQGSNGETLAGLEHEEEALPPFVHNRNPVLDTNRFELNRSINCQGMGCKAGCCKGECCDRLVNLDEPLLVTQKMETPVLYFYSDKAMRADVTVDFPQGIISQYYPAPTSFLPPVTTQGLKGGQIHYSQLEVLTDSVPVPAVNSGNVYAPARQTSANFVRVQDEAEKFIFYRGLGNFKTALKITSDASNLTVQNTEAQRIPFMLALNIKNGKGSFKVLGGLAGNQSNSFNTKQLMKELTPTENMDRFEKQVGPVLVKALVQSGLYQDEAQSMVNTWRLSYFHTEGLRVLYVLSRTETDRILPIKISPQPENLVRTLVGRIEVLTKQEEDRLVASGNIPSDRFKEPKMIRVRQLTSN